MKYMGSKARIWKHIAPIILANRLPYYVEPFCGGCNSLDKVTGPRIGVDSNWYLIEMWKALQTGWTPPEFISEDFYNDIRLYPSPFEPALVAYVGFSLSFGGKWFGGYRRDKKGQKGDVKNMALQSIRSYRSIMEQAEKLKDVKFLNCNYNEFYFPKATVYCDPPYQGTTLYKTESFDYDAFWNWVRKISKSNQVFVSEYSAPEDFRCIWSMEIKSSLTQQTDAKKGVEKLFVCG